MSLLVHQSDKMSQVDNSRLPKNKATGCSNRGNAEFALLDARSGLRPGFGDPAQLVAEILGALPPLVRHPRQTFLDDAIERGRAG